MEEDLEVDKDYLEAFNQGYELAKVLNLKSPMLKYMDSDNVRMNAMKAGMAQYIDEFKQGLHERFSQNKYIDSDKYIDEDLSFKKNSKEDKSKGFGLSN